MRVYHSLRINSDIWITKHLCLFSFRIPHTPPLHRQQLTKRTGSHATYTKSRRFSSVVSTNHRTHRPTLQTIYVTPEAARNVRMRLEMTRQLVRAAMTVYTSNIHRTTPLVIITTVTVSRQNKMAAVMMSQQKIFL